jgi:BirA family biotin operon repressor/biotin-[acetyl-CoA-carboxylase] ligase
VLGPSTAVIGVGVNVRLSQALRADIDQAVTDLETLTGAFVDRNFALACLLRHLVAVLEIYAQEGFAPLKESWLAFHAYEGREVWLQMPKGERQTGRVSGVAEDGSLLLSTEQGQKRYTVGEISVRATPQPK